MSFRTTSGLTVIAAAAIFAVGCGGGGGDSSSTATKTAAKKTAKSINSPFIFTVQGSEVTVAVTGKQATPVSDLQAQVVCANLAAKGFADRNEATTTWKKAATSVSVTLPKSADGQDLCAISFPTLKKQAVAFFDEAAKKQYLSDAQAAK
jgi:hypothetical protein